MQVIIDGKKANFTPAPGMSAYQVAVKNGFTGTETEWLESLKGSGWQEYSTEEIPVGTWIDGKTIYRRVCSGTTSASTGKWKSIATIDDTKIDSVVSIHWTVGNSADEYICGNDRETVAGYNNISNSLSVYTLASNRTNQPITVIFEYTKTTD